MEREILVSIRPSWAALILNKKKKVEIRKNIPLRVKLPFTAYVYCSKGEGDFFFNIKEKEKNISGTVCAKLTVDAVERYGMPTEIEEKKKKEMCLTETDLWRYYVNYRGKLCGWHISDVELFNEPLQLSDFGLDNPPQSWCYVEKKQKERKKNENSD